MNDIVLEASVVNIEPQTEVLVDAVSDAEAVVLDAVVRLENNEFVLSSGGMYGGGALIGSIPAWVLEAVNQRLTTGDGNIAGLVNDLQTALDALETGVNQSISNLESDVLSQSGLITSLRSDVDGNNATIMNVLATKVTESQASAVALSAIQSKFGTDVDAYIGNIASTYVDADSAIATEIDMMQASLNGVSASISDISSITIETVQNPLWIDDGIGTDPDINDEPRWIDQAKAKKQLEVNADGVITGILLESGQTSSMTVQADEFKLVATGQSVASRNPFTVNATTGEITFVGKVSFNSVTDVPALGSTPQQVVDAVNAGTTTTIDGGKITTGTVAANVLKPSVGSTTTWTGGSLQSSDFTTIGGAGFRLKSNATGTSADPAIYGAYISGGTLEGSYIKGGTIDSSTMNVRKLIVVTDAELSTKAIITVPVTRTSANSYYYAKYEGELYAYNSSGVSTSNRAASLSCPYYFMGGRTYQLYSHYVSQQGEVIEELSYKEWVLVASVEGTAGAVTVTVNGSSSAISANTTVSVNGFTFHHRSFYSSTDTSLLYSGIFLQPIGALTGFTGNSKFSVEISSQYPMNYISYFPHITVLNL